MRRVKMLEYALRQERKKYVTGVLPPASKEAVAADEGKAVDSPNAPSSPANNAAVLPENQQPRLPSEKQWSLGPAFGPAGDAKGRARSREMLKMCLQEISYLTNTPTRIPTSNPALVPFPNYHNLTTLPPHIRASLMREREAAAAAATTSQGNFPKSNRNSAIFVGSNPQPANIITPPASTLSQSLSKTAAASAALLAAQGKTRSATPATASPTTPSAQHPLPPPPPTTSNSAGASEDDEMIDPLGAGDRREQGGADGPERALLQERERDADMEEAVPENVDEVAMMVSARKKWKQQQQQLQKQQMVQAKMARKADRAAAAAGVEEDGEEEGIEDDQLTRDVQQKYNLSDASVNKLIRNSSRGLKNERKSATSPEPGLDELANLSLDEEINKAEAQGKKERTAMEHQPRMWRTKFTLRSHLDTVRSVAFHSTEMVIISGSEDGTVKLWNLKSSLDRDGGVSKKAAHQDIEPNITYRGHSYMVTSVALSAEQGRAYSASLDSTIRVWRMPPEGRETYAAVDPSLNLASYVGHTDAIWDIRLFPLPGVSHLLASASADGTIKIWDTATGSSPLKNSWSYTGVEGASMGGVRHIPTSLDFCPTDLKKLAVSYTNSIIKVFDVETGQVVTTFKGDETYDNTSATQINRIVAHTTMSLVISGHEDRHIRFFDLNSGSCTFSMQAHLDGVTSLDVDPSGLTLVSGGHDSSIRLWDISSSARTCVQEFTGHRRKGDEGVLSVRYHQSLPWMVSGGADGIVKVYQHGV
ncbi:WD40-repeat-containing domain protein [Jimgerdemannia flammicorona]|uniref:WD40-repeat-containing domain protein n=1 Tax=Jimgerdemannia flammicorona TaxID=994334 RepID=A0A433CZG4_9FUNG|nr:WD40-repeat-containing domain protein [Jimgerdemannia flammicorona]